MDSTPRLPTTPDLAAREAAILDRHRAGSSLPTDAQDLIDLRNEMRRQRRACSLDALGRSLMPDPRSIADAYVRSHISPRDARALLADDGERLEFQDAVAAYLGDHPLLDEAAYADLCDVAAEAVADHAAPGAIR